MTEIVRVPQEFLSFDLLNAVHFLIVGVPLARLNYQVRNVVVKTLIRVSDAIEQSDPRRNYNSRCPVLSLLELRMCDRYVVTTFFDKFIHFLDELIEKSIQVRRFEGRSATFKFKVQV